MEIAELQSAPMPRPTRPEMRSYIMAILDELHTLSIEYGLSDLAEGLDAARSSGQRFEQ